MKKRIIPIVCCLLGFAIILNAPIVASDFAGRYTQHASGSIDLNL